MEESSRYDLLIDPANTVYASNCEVKDTELTVGALYVSPNNPFGVIRLSDRAARFDVELPPELVGSDQFVAVWNISLPLVAADND